jgi:hypothetical protein
MDEAAVVASDGGRMRFYAGEVLGEQRMLTPEGFLLCLNVPIARTGTQLYHISELASGVTAGPDGVVRVLREPEHVFTDEHISSYNGKPVVNDHPQRDVTPTMWHSVSVGTVMAPRRGDGVMQDCIVADLIIYDPEAIKDVQAGKREVSCGYDANYEEIAPGQGKQVNLFGNHVALVDSGRCGPRCSIGDHSSCTGDQDMRFNDNALRPAWLDRMMKAFAAKDEAAFTAAATEAAAAAGGNGAEELHLHVSAPGAVRTNDRHMSDADIEERFEGLEKKMDAGFKRMMDALEAGGPMGAQAQTDAAEEEKLEKALEEESSGGTKDAMIKTRDSRYLGDAMSATAALAEILVPGIHLPTYDAKATAKSTLDAVCGLRRTTLDLAYATPEGRDVISAVHGREMRLADMSCSDVRVLFNAAAALKRSRNNDAARGTNDTARRAADTQGSGGGLGVRSTVKSPAELNKRNAEFYGKSA